MLESMPWEVLWQVGRDCGELLLFCVGLVPSSRYGHSNSLVVEGVTPLLQFNSPDVRAERPAACLEPGRGLGVGWARVFAEPGFARHARRGRKHFDGAAAVVMSLCSCCG